jgi:aromatic-L-amino-acid/L-tryptophan decarboxylase
MEAIFADFERIVPGHDPLAASALLRLFPGQRRAGLDAGRATRQRHGRAGMLWQTSPAATEIEEVMMRWLRDALGLGGHFTGTIHDSATTATLCAVLTMRERRRSAGRATPPGLSGQPTLRLYASAQAHSSVDKAARIAGIGQENLVKVPTDAALRWTPRPWRCAPSPPTGRRATCPSA